MADAAQTVTSMALGFVKDAATGKVPASFTLPGITRALGGAVFDEAVFDSQFSPEIAVQPWAPGDGEKDTPPSPLPGLLGGQVRPRIRLRKNGETVATFAPFGEPNGVWLPNAVGATGAVVAVTAFMLGHRKTAMAAALVSAAGFGLGYMTRPRA